MQGEKKKRKETEKYVADSHKAIDHYREVISGMKEELEEAKKGKLLYF